MLLATLLASAYLAVAPGASLWIGCALIVAGSLMAVAYIWRIVEAAWFRDPEDGKPEFSEALMPMLLITWIAALANLYFGLAPSLQIRRFAASSAGSPGSR